MRELRDRERETPHFRFHSVENLAWYVVHKCGWENCSFDILVFSQSGEIITRLNFG